MPYTLFHNYFPQLAEAETRTLIVFDAQKLPQDQYALLELYCDEKGCDCKRVLLNVFSEKNKKFLATITFGWESREFYAKWLGENESATIDQLKGPALNFGSPQSELAPALLKEISEVVLTDRTYIERLKRHYRLFKERIESPDPRAGNKVKIGRNDPCPCESGRKFKHCCGN